MEGHTFELDRTRDLLQVVVDSSPDWVFVKNLEHRFMLVNQAFAAAQNLQPADMVGRCDTEFWSEEFCLGNPAKGFRGFHEDDKEAFSGRTVHNPNDLATLHDGTLRVFDTYKGPLKDASGRIYGVLCYCRDITDRKQAEEALHTLNLELEERVRQRTVELSRANDELRVEVLERRKVEEALRRYEHIASASRDHMSFVGRDYIYQAVNDTYLKVHNRKREEIVGHSVADILGKEVFERLVKPNLDKCLAGCEVHYESWFDLAGTGRRCLDVAYYPFFDEDGSVSGVVVSSRDITERKQAEEDRRRLEEQMRHAQKLESLGVMAGGIAHDFNNILMVVLGHAELTMMQLPEGSSLREDIQAIVKAAVRAADLSKQMLAYSGKGRFVVRALDLGEVVRDITSMLSVSISKKVQLHLNLAADLPAINADVSQLHQVIMNLVINASDAIGDGTGNITVSTGSMHCDRAFLSQTWLDENLPEGFYVYLEIVDTGCGMDKETLSRIFDPFFTTKFAGRGLGLAAVLGIIRSHRGALNIWSEPGKGARFTVLFPVAPKPAQDIEEESPVHKLAGRGTVLLVDDEDSVREVAGKMLENMGLKVLKASDGREALEVFRAQQENISCVLLDLTMPEMDGEETFHELKKIRAGVRVVLSSGYTSEDLLRRFVENGLAGFIEKPYTLDSLASNIGRVLDAGAGCKDSDIGKVNSKEIGNSALKGELKK